MARKRARQSPRSRAAAKPRSANALDAGVRFVSAATSTSDPNVQHMDLVDKLNGSAADERRRALLEKLRAISAERDVLRQSAVPTSGVDGSRDGEARKFASEGVAGDERYEATRPYDHPVSAQSRFGLEVSSTIDKHATRGSRPASQSRASTAASLKAMYGAVSELSPVSSPAPNTPVIAAYPPGSPVETSSTTAGCDSPAADTVRASDPPCEDTTSGRPGGRPTRRTSRSRVPSVLLRDALTNNGESYAGTFSGTSRCKSLVFCRKLVNSMLRNIDAKPFAAPVRELWPDSAIPGYFDIIKTPMDLGTVKKRLEAGVYLRPVLSAQAASCSSPKPSTSSAGVSGFVFDIAAFKDDVALCFKNCMTYCPEADILHKTAKQLLERFEAEMQHSPVPVEIISDASGRRTSKGRARPSIQGSDDAMDCSESGPRRGAKSSSRSKYGTASRSKNKRAPCSESDMDDADGTDESGVNGDPWTSTMDSRLASLDRKGLKERLEFLLHCRVYMIMRDTRCARRDVPMTLEEKTNLSERVSLIPADKLPRLLAIVSTAEDSNTKSSASDEIEIDMDTLGTCALRDIESLVEKSAGQTPAEKLAASKRRSGALTAEFKNTPQVEYEIACVKAKLGVQTLSAQTGPRKATGLWEDSSSSGESDSGSSDSSSDSESSGDSDDSDEE